MSLYIVCAWCWDTGYSAPGLECSYCRLHRAQPPSARRAALGCTAGGEARLRAPDETRMSPGDFIWAYADGEPFAATVVEDNGCGSIMAAVDGWVFKLNRYTWTRRTCGALDAERGG